MKVDYTNAITRKMKDEYEVKITKTGIFWAIFRRGNKVMEVMNCKDGYAQHVIMGYLKRRGIDYYRDFLPA